MKESPAWQPPNSTTQQLSFHKGSGNYCKTVKGKRFYLGRDYDPTLEMWFKYRADFEVGIDSRKTRQGAKPKRLNVRDSCNLFLDRRKTDEAEATSTS